MGDVYFALAFQALRGAASSVDCKLLNTAAQKPNSAPISDPHKKVQIQGERLGTGKVPKTAAMLIAEFDCVQSAADDLT